MAFFLLVVFQVFLEFLFISFLTDIFFPNVKGFLHLINLLSLLAGDFFTSFEVPFLIIFFFKWVVQLWVLQLWLVSSTQQQIATDLIVSNRFRSYLIPNPESATECSLITVTIKHRSLTCLYTYSISVYLYLLSTYFLPSLAFHHARCHSRSCHNTCLYFNDYLYSYISIDHLHVCSILRPNKYILFSVASFPSCKVSLQELSP